MKVCESLAQSGAEVSLILPGRKTHLRQSPFQYYGVEENFSICVEKVPDLIRFGRIGFILSQIFFGLRAAWRYRHTDVVISQDEWILLWCRMLSIPFVYEVHNGRDNIAARIAAKHSLFLVANSEGTRNFYVRQGIEKANILVCPNGVDIDRFNISLSQQEARAKLHFPSDKKIVLYTGHLYDWKGADTLAASAAFLSEDIEIVFVGGTEKNVASFTTTFAHLPQINIRGHQPSGEIPKYLRAADILVLPNARIGESEQFTSPMKLFEYMAAGKPIVASDLPSVREILTEKEAFFFTPGDVESLARTIVSVLAEPENASQKSANAHEKAQMYTWNREELLQKIKTHLKRK